MNAQKMFEELGYEIQNNKDEIYNFTWAFEEAIMCFTKKSKAIKNNGVIPQVEYLRNFINGKLKDKSVANLKLDTIQKTLELGNNLLKPVIFYDGVVFVKNKKTKEFLYHWEERLENGYQIYCDEEENIEIHNKKLYQAITQQMKELGWV